MSYVYRATISQFGEPIGDRWTVACQPTQLVLSSHSRGQFYIPWSVVSEFKASKLDSPATRNYELILHSSALAQLGANYLQTFHSALHLELNIMDQPLMIPQSVPTFLGDVLQKGCLECIPSGIKYQAYKVKSFYLDFQAVGECTKTGASEQWGPEQKEWLRQSIAMVDQKSCEINFVRFDKNV